MVCACDPSQSTHKPYVSDTACSKSSDTKIPKRCVAKAITVNSDHNGDREVGLSAPSSLIITSLELIQYL